MFLKIGSLNQDHDKTGHLRPLIILEIFNSHLNFNSNNPTLNKERKNEKQKEAINSKPESLMMFLKRHSKKRVLNTRNRTDIQNTRL